MREFEYLVIKNVRKEFSNGKKSIRALEDIEINIEQRKFVALVGSSGCGKSTLLRIIAGLETPTEGKVFFQRSDGDELIQRPSKDRAMVFQSYTSFPWLSVRKNIEFPLTLHPGEYSKQDRNELVEKYLELTNLSDFEGCYPDTLSGGMRQRVALARTLINNPSVLLMDEPFGALDAQTRWQMQDLLLKVWEKIRCTVIFVTHDIEEAIYLADDVYVFSQRPGRIKRTERIPFPRPRNPEIKVTEEFKNLQIEICRVINEPVLNISSSGDGSI